MKKSVLLTAVAATMGLMGVAQAHNHDKSCNHHGVSFDHATVQYGSGDKYWVWDDALGFEVQDDVLGFEVQRTIGNGVFVEAGYKRIDREVTNFGDFNIDAFNFDIDAFNLGLGYAYALNGETSVYGSLGALKLDSDEFVAGVDDDGHYMTLGMKHMLFKKVEVDGKFVRTDILDEKDNDFTLAAKYYFHKDWTVNAGYTFDAKETFVGVSYHF